MAVAPVEAVVDVPEAVEAEAEENEIGKELLLTPRTLSVLI